MTKIPTTIVTGFLGSGKTTLIKNAVEKIWNVEKIAIIKNEIGDVGVDEMEFKNDKLIVTELENGCICCTLVGQMNDSLREIVAKYKPDRIIIEASGLAKPAQIAISLDLIEELEIDGVIVVIDALNYNFVDEKHKAWSDKMQTEFVDLYILNKVNQVPSRVVENISDDILELNSDARIIETENAQLPVDLIFGLHHSFVNFEDEIFHDHEENSTDEFETFTIHDFEVKTKDGLELFCNALPKRIFRSKGYFQDNKGAKWILNFVAGKVKFEETNADFDKSNIVFIGKKILMYKEDLEKKLTH